MNGVPREVPGPKPKGPQAPRVLAARLSQGTPFTTLHPRLFHIMSFFGNPGLVKRNIFYCRQTQPVPREYHTKCYIQTLIELNPNILVGRFQRMPLSTVLASLTLSLRDTFSTLPLRFPTVAFTLLQRKLTDGPWVKCEPLTLPLWDM